MSFGTLRLKIASVNVKVPPKAGDAQHLGRAGAQRLVGDAPWILSALPECLRQIAESAGPSQRYVLAHLPADARRVTPPARLTYADCTIRVRGDEAFVDRGSDHFRIPPHAEFYLTHGDLALFRHAGGTSELRYYVPVHGSLR